MIAKILILFFLFCCPAEAGIKFGFDQGMSVEKAQKIVKAKYKKKWQFMKHLKSVFGDSECWHCKYNVSYVVLQFHHVDPAEKEQSVTQYDYRKELKELLAEAKKTVLLCQNCHAIYHSKKHNDIDRKKANKIRRKLDMYRDSYDYKFLASQRIKKFLETLDKSSLSEGEIDDIINFFEDNPDEDYFDFERMLRMHGELDVHYNLTDYLNDLLLDDIAGLGLQGHTFDPSDQAILTGLKEDRFLSEYVDTNFNINPVGSMMYAGSVRVNR